MKVYVYAICKNEEKFVNEWVSSMKEADGIYVLDTGSTDNTVKLLERNGINVKVYDFTSEGKEFRFDVARNLSLDMVPDDADICVCTDMDEIFTAGWRKEVEEQWTEEKKLNPKVNSGYYDYIHTYDRNGNPVSRFLNFKIHQRHDVHWEYPCHEVPVYEKGQQSIIIKNITLMHHQDLTKPRSDLYLHLLEIGAKEKPDDARAIHYLGREYMYHKMYEKAISTLKHQLEIKNAWVNERAQAMRFIGRCYKEQKEFEKAESWYLRAIAESKEQREAAIELSQMALDNGNGELGALAAKLALTVKSKNGTYLTEDKSWSYLPYDYLAIGESMSKTMNFHTRAKATSIALAKNMYDKRLWRNMINCNGRSPVYPVPKEYGLAIEEYEKMDPKVEKVDWSKYDRIYCIHYVEDKCREESMAQEFERIGLKGRDNFEIVETVRIKYEDKFKDAGDCNAGIRNLALNTLMVLQRSKIHGYKRILILEDDVRFLKDLALLADIFNNSPDADVICYDKMNYLYPPEYWELCEKRKINRHYASWDNGIYSGACYSLSAKGIEYCISEYEKHLIAPDDVLQIGGLSKAFSYISVSCQQCHKDALYIERYGGYNMKNGYAFQGLDYSQYNVDEGYGYDKMFTEEEIVETMWR